ncbi:SusC/RagA family TonB-linked outer membrane protein [Mucilaginibacter aquaedulcis]|uniref:SusC/RagA family TonB-linked outer membrane protein n=1 Tax=Mucilaginibacter aquaedulcis TaxID=1187081 RepID=UPI0025B48977|nr:SusC/RagA family TonB-linked outer membrane protein [Mucilaginibacter aquaedulcis]MDN3548689.1 SusC/RagA family TonB-linked outer membrane protein [Mucilaginibacter aquaedulcis]
MKIKLKPGAIWPGMSKLLLVMKLIAIILFVAFTQVHAGSFAQNITIHESNVPVERILQQIKKQSNYHFIYDSKLNLLKTQMVSVQADGATINQVLDQCLKDLPVSYTIIQQTIAIKGNAEKNQIKAAEKVPVTITGKVTDAKNQPLPGVNIVLKGSTQGTVSASDGSYQLKLADNKGILVFSFIGFLTTEVALTADKTVINVQLRDEPRNLNEIVVVGYGTQRRGDITSAIASVKSESFVKGSVTDAAQLIRGKVAGLSVVTTDGNPTATSQINLRGITTLLSGTAPLVLIDGVPGTLTTVAPEDIESIDVLKDGSAAAIYGTRGTNGVILITTKKAKANTAPSIELNTYFSTQRITKKLDFMNADEYRQLVAEKKPGATDYGYNTNWLDQVTRTPFSQVYNISLKGATQNTNYVVNLNYRRLEGIMKQSDNNILYPRIEVNHSMFDGKLKLNANLSGFEQNYYVGTSGDLNNASGISDAGFNTAVYRNALTYNPTDRIKDDSGKFIEHPDKTDYQNPVSLLQNTIGLNKSSNLRTIGTITYLPIDDLNIKLLGSRNLNNYNVGYYETKDQYSTVHDGKNGYAAVTNLRNQEDLIELTANYNKRFNDHQINVLGGYSWRQLNAQFSSMSNFDFPTDEFTYNNIRAGLALSRGQATLSSNQSENKLISYFSRVNYSYKDKYLLTASIRREGSSKFGANHKYGNFPAVSGGWNLMKESFLGNSKTLSNLKLRAGYGITGTEPASAYQSLDKLNFNTYSYFNGQFIQVVNPSSNSNPDLRWEKKAEINIGLDFGFLNNRLSGTIDAYRRKTTDLLFNYPVASPPYLYSNIIANAASMRNEGIEVQINAIPITTTNFQWNTSVNYSTNKNKLLSLSDKNFQLASGFFDVGYTGEPIQQQTGRVQIGQPLGNFYGFKSVDIDETGHWIIQGADGKPKPIANQQASDKTILGNGLPKHYLSWNNSFNYKRFDLNITMRGAFGFQIYNSAQLFYSAPVMLTRGNLLKGAYDKIYNKVPLADDQSLQYVSYYIENGSFWKIDNVTLGYNLPVKTKAIKGIRIYASASNLKTFTGYKGIDPEVSILTSDNSSNLLAPGVDDKNRYPATSTYTLGAFFTF